MIAVSRSVFFPVNSTLGELTKIEFGHLCINQSTVRDFVQKGELAKVPIGKREYRIRRGEVNRFIRERESRQGQSE